MHVSHPMHVCLRLHSLHSGVIAEPFLCVSSLQLYVDCRHSGAGPNTLVGHVA